ncbi:hypothetical protein [Brevibacillus agri]|uniref:hypothetical protein n=1 Tax=Brevibacillus agri TaxID=51101 RepID=UPI000419051E|nr:hypothetical protein [Brevibacillus agri]
MKIFHLGCSLLNPIQKGEIALLHVRAITADEVTAFAAFGRQSGQVVHDVATYLEAMLAKGAMRREWCFVLEKEGRGWEDSPSGRCLEAKWRQTSCYGMCRGKRLTAPGLGLLCFARRAC